MISIVLPVKNEEKYIAECLDSILNQTFHDWELIVVDDHSTDLTRTIISHHQINKLDATKVILNPGDGLLDALDAGLAHTSGTYITRMDGDDLMVPHRLAMMHQTLSGAKKNTIVCGQVTYFPREALSRGYQTYERWINNVQEEQSHAKWMYRECVFASPNWMMKTADLRSAGGFAGLPYPEDYALALRCYQSGFHFKGIAEVTLLWRHHKDRISLNHPGFQQKAFFELKVSHWIAFHYNQARDLLLWGNNKKTKLTCSVLDQNQMKYSILDEQEVNLTSNYDKPMVLITVFPPKKIRDHMRRYLDRMQMMEGQDYWFL